MSTLKVNSIQHPSSSTPAITLDSTGNISGAIQYPYRNKIINGAFDIWQRGTSIAFAGTAYQYMIDRWRFVRGNFATGMTVSRQDAGLTGFRYCARVQRDSGNTSTQYLEMVQTLETSESIKISGQPVTFSFYARSGANFSSASNLLIGSIIYGTGIDQPNDLFTGRTVLTSPSVTLTASWQKFSITATMPSNATGVAVGFSYAPIGTAGAADYFEVTGVQLETGSVATPFEFKSFGQELRECQRYYWHHSKNADGLNSVFFHAQIWTNNGQGYIQFPQSMRIAPALTTTGTFGLHSGGVTTQTLSSVSANGTTQESSRIAIAFTYTPSTQGISGQVYAGSSPSVMAWNAEL